MKCHFLLLITLTPALIYGQRVELLDDALNTFQNVRDFCFSQNNEEAYFTVQSPNQELSQIVVVKNRKWNKPELVSFCDAYSYLEPFLSLDEKKLFFASDRPKNDSIQSKSDYDIWFVERKDLKSEWSKPINMGANVNSENNEFYPTLSANNNLYFTMESKSGMGKDDIYFCKWNGNEYAKPILLSTNINSEGYEFNAFISKDESFLIYTRYNAKEGLGSGDLYLSRKDDKGEWKVSVNMGNVINTQNMEYCPFYDSKNNILYFTSKRNSLRPKNFNTFADFHTYISGDENGLSKIYKYPIKI
jgi:hypothetical protein